MPNLIPLTGFCVATWATQYAAHQLIGLRIVTDRFIKRGILPGDFALVHKAQFVNKIRDGDLIVVATGEDSLTVTEYSSSTAPSAETLLGRIVRIWREY